VASAGVGEADDDLGGADRADPGTVEEAGCEVLGDRAELRAVVLECADGIA
jgi:hypothetical protein